MEQFYEYQKHFLSTHTLHDCKDFISHSQTDNSNLHLAITDDTDNYMGTVSLKHVVDNTAEFAIVLHPNAIGLGYARYAIPEILSIGFNKLNLKEIYWNVLKSNIRAIKCYNKNGYKRFVPDSVKYLTWGEYSTSSQDRFYWYKISKKEFVKE